MNQPSAGKGAMLRAISLREKVYELLRSQMNRGKLLPGVTVDLNFLSKELKVSKTPLRDALIMLERDGFVDILPRKGFKVRNISTEDVRDMYEIIGALEGMVIRKFFHRLGANAVARMERLNQRMVKAVTNDEFDKYYKLNLEFHNVYLRLSPNQEMRQYLDILKQRLYDFPRRSYIKDWEMHNCEEHAQFVGMVRAGVVEGAVSVMRDIHWSYSVQQEQIDKFYKRVNHHIQEHIKNTNHG